MQSYRAVLVLLIGCSVGFPALAAQGVGADTSVVARPDSTAIAATIAHRTGVLSPGLRLRVQQPWWNSWHEAYTTRVGDSVTIVDKVGTSLPRTPLTNIEVYAGRSTKTRRGIRRGAVVGLVAGTVVGALVVAGCAFPDSNCGDAAGGYFMANVAGWTGTFAIIGGLMGSVGRFDNWVSVPPR